MMVGIADMAFEKKMKSCGSGLGYGGRAVKSNRFAKPGGNLQEVVPIVRSVVNNLGKCSENPRITRPNGGFQRSYQTDVPELFAWILESCSQGLTAFFRVLKS